MDLLFGDYRLRRHERDLLGPDGPVELSARSFDLLRTLLERPEQLVDKTALFDAVWPGVVVEENTLQVHMSALRKALGPGYVATVHGRGYKYVGPAPRPDDASVALRPDGSAGNIDRFGGDCIAREQEIAAVGQLLEQHRLVTIVGPGGVGKTTLAVAIAGTLDEVAGGIWMVDLASISSGDFVESVLIQTLAVPFRAGSKPLDLVAEYLRETEAVLVFDNCEHVRGAVARVARTLLAAAPGVRILATSQMALGLAEEHVFKLLPFAVEAGGLAGDTASARFLAYCYEVFGESLSEAEKPIVERLCRRLDGVALAIKMAAARAATVGIETVDRQLEQQLASLEADWDPALPRHRSLAASLAWSYGLLSGADQRIFRLLAALHGSFSIEAVSAVSGEDAAPRVAELVRRSLVVRTGPDRSRYRMLDATRHFAFDKLAEAGEEADARSAQARWVARHFEAGLASWETMPDIEWERLFRPDGDNLRAALAWSRSRADWPLYVELAAASYRYFIQEQLGAEGFETIEAGIALIGTVPPELAARLQHALGEICRFNAMDVRARQGLEPALAHFRGSADAMRYAQVLVLLTWITIFFRAPPEAIPLVREIQQLMPRIPDSKVKAWALVAVGTQAMIDGDRTAGLARAEAGLAMHAQLGNSKGRYRSAINLCEMLHGMGDTARALRIAEQILPDFRRDGSSLQLCIMLTNIAAYNFALGQPDAAEAPLREAIHVVPRDGGHWHWCLLQGMAELAANRGAAADAALVLGFTDKCFDGWIDGRQATEAAQRRRLMSLLQDALADGERDRLIQEGRTLSLFEADHLVGFATPGRLRL
jgi:predicted ATPase/DNA-binding winged helix-turn-helix (wHTH) protein